MNDLIKEVWKLKKTKTGKEVQKRLQEFLEFKNKNDSDWFSELCFCILTANSKASTAIKVHDELGYQGFSSHSHKKVADCIRRNKHRFHNNKAKFIVGARVYLNIKEKISKFDNSLDARVWLVENIKGIGFKEASHFLRNIGYFDLAILDRHIINLMLEYGLLDKKPTNLAEKNYLLVEKKFKKLSDEAKMSPAELDLYMWCLKAGEVLR